MIPSFSLGKPAAVFEASVGRRLTFDPQLRFSLNGKPWSFVFWWKYKLLKPGKFQLSVGAHPAFMFVSKNIPTDSLASDIIEARRFVATEIVPRYKINDHVSIGLYYLYGHALQSHGVQNSHFITLNAGFSNLRISEKYTFSFTPQIFYLKSDHESGNFFTSTFTLSGKNLPLTLSSLINKRISGYITGSKSFIWNITLTYTFDKQFVRR